MLVHTGEWSTYSRPISIHGFRAFVDSEDVHRSFPVAVVKYDTDLVINVFWRHPAALPFIFDRQKGTMKHYHVQAFIMQLFTVGILHFTDVDKEGSATVRLGRVANDSQNTKYDETYKTSNVYDELNVMKECSRTTPLNVLFDKFRPKSS
jgi:hypothetical protein